MTKIFNSPFSSFIIACLFVAPALNSTAQKTIIGNGQSEFACQPTQSFTPEHKMTLWYDRPATLTGVSNPWMEYSLPIGNGELGACIFGGLKVDEIQFNEKTLWAGTTEGQGEYKNFGSVFVEDCSGVFGYSETSAAKDYYRCLDLESGLGRVHYTSTDGTTTYDRTYLSSFPDKVIAVRYTAKGGKRLNLLITAIPGEDINASAVTYCCGTTNEGGSKSAANMANLNFSGKLETVSYQARAQIVTDGGKVIPTGKGIRVEGADNLTLYLCARTNFSSTAESRSSGLSIDQLCEANRMVLQKAIKKGYDKIFTDHVRDVTALMSRVELDLNTYSRRTTNELVDYYNSLSDINNPEARFLEQLYFYYGRYLEISSSRGLPAPSNLQGIWNNMSHPAWYSDIHTNINVQMNYWPAETTNLSETHLPFLQYIIDNSTSEPWTKAARLWGGVNDGWTVLTCSSIFGGMSDWGSNYVVANAWYCSHLWQHFLYTRDTKFLAKAFPAMWSCAKFWMERLIPDRGYDSKRDNGNYKGTPYSFQPDGTFVAPNEFSPEQGGHDSEDGTAHAQQLIHYMLSSVKQAIEALPRKTTDISDADIAKLNEYLQKTDNGLHTEIYTANSALNEEWTNPRNGIKKGDVILREWKYSPYDVSNDPSHRHLSHLMCLYPLVQIGPDSEYFQAAVNSLLLRGDEATGWSMGWKTCLWAHALDGNHAHRILHNAMRHSTSYGTEWYNGGLYYNLFDAHCPFQIDGNFGVCAGIAEMLMQSQTGTIILLPALPTEWADGHANGLRAVGNFEIDQQWKAGRLINARIQSFSGLPCTLRYPGIAKFSVTNAKGKSIPFTALDANTIRFDTSAGKTYKIVNSN